MKVVANWWWQMFGCKDVILSDSNGLMRATAINCRITTRFPNDTVNVTQFLLEKLQRALIIDLDKHPDLNKHIWLCFEGFECRLLLHASYKERVKHYLQTLEAGRHLNWFDLELAATLLGASFLRSGILFELGYMIVL